MTSLRVLAAVIVGVVAIWLGAFSPAPAEAATLQYLVDNYDDPQGEGAVVCGDKRFYHFQVFINGGNFLGGPASFLADPSAIEVTPGMNALDEYGFTMQTATGGPIISADPGSYVDVLVTFEVGVEDPDYYVTDISLDFDASVPLDGFSQVVETAYDGIQVIGQAHVEVPPSPSQPAHVDLDPGYYQTIYIEKDILVVGGTQFASEISTISQHFSQMPEPGSLTLLALGGFFCFKRRRALDWIRPGIVACALIAMVGLAFQPATASATLLADLIQDPGNSVVSGDKTFDSFTFDIVNQQGTVIANAASLDVVPTFIGGDYGIKFAGPLMAFPGSVLEVVIAFDVTVDDPNQRIHDISLAFNGVATAPGGIVTLTETVYDDQSTEVGSAMVSAAGPLSVADFPLTGEFQTIHVVKEIIMRPSSLGTGTISSITQTFSQVPEPAVATLMFGGIPLLLKRRR